jgi:RimJ/RimL family protein N-acetyltransferase
LPPLTNAIEYCYVQSAYSQGRRFRMSVSGVLVLRDGTSVPVREIRAEDAPALQRLVGRSSERSIELRFFGPMKELSEERARRFADVDGKDRFALVALDPEDEGEIVAVVRYERERGTDGAEYAALVEDRFQGRGLGIGLTRRLIEAAQERGIERLHALVLRENSRMLRLLRSLEFPERERWENGLEHIEIDLRPGAAA